MANTQAEIPTIKEKNRNGIILTAIAVVTLVAWNVPYGMYVMYPFTIFGTWIHEMSHGLTAMFLGANFTKLELFSNGSGAACYTYTSLVFGKVGIAMIAAAGPLGPAIVGAISIACSRNKTMTEICLYAFSALLLISLIKWVRPLMSLAFGVIVGFTILITWVAYNGNPKIKKFLLQTIGINSIVSLYFSVGYIFSDSAAVAGGNYASDTQVIENNLFLPHWFWGGLIILIAVFLLYNSIKIVMKK